MPARFGPMAIGIDETGNYQFSLTVKDPAGHTATTSAVVWATPPSSGLRSVPFNVPGVVPGGRHLRDDVELDARAPAGSHAIAERTAPASSSRSRPTCRGATR